MPEKYSRARPGRPRKGHRRDGYLKSTAGDTLTRALYAGLLQCILSDFPPGASQGRRLSCQSPPNEMMRSLRVPSDTVPAPRPVRLCQWLRERSLPVEHRVPGTEFMLGELMVDCSADSEIVPEAIDPLLQWVGFFQDCRMTLSEIGLGMQAITGSLALCIEVPNSRVTNQIYPIYVCLLYTSDAADEEDSVDLGGRRIIKKKKKNQQSENRK
eukprot:TRINITY_DN14023_c0_g1_i3.p1 TRINITY_DN14023_c0_g1~~TRINITY_DN14023_c0_g1_i3.p1  ORF type:complete len:213 (+),score=27.39 TRINITY_DN14023_c0_g1_i3:130-768(+)